MKTIGKKSGEGYIVKSVYKWKEEKMRHYCEECEETTEWEYEIYFEGRGSRPDWQRFMTEDQPQGYWTCQECGQVIKDEDFDEDDINNKEKENEN